MTLMSTLPIFIAAALYCPVVVMADPPVKVTWIDTLKTKTRIATFIKTKLKKSDDQTYIDKYRVAANFT